MFENIVNFFKKLGKREENKKEKENSKDTAKERLHLVLMQDRANVSVDFLELMKQEIIEVIKKYIEIDEKEIDVRLTNQENEDGTNGAPALYANIPILNIKNDTRKYSKTNVEDKEKDKLEDKEENKKEVEVEDKKIDEKKDEEIEKSKEENKEENEEIEVKEENKEEEIKEEEKQEQKEEVKEEIKSEQ